MKQPKQRKPRHKLLILLLLVLGCVAVLATGTYAAYTEYKTVNRVVVARTREDFDGLRFSSNLLFVYELNDDNYEERSISVSSSGDVRIDLMVCNYPQSAPASFNDSDIGYNMSIIAKGTDITFEPQKGFLKGGKPSSVSHSITIPADFVSAVSSGYLTVVVTPDKEYQEATMNKKLAANLKIVPKEAAPSGWSGTLIFEGGSENSAKNDAINYHIHGTEECDMVLSWGEKVKLGKWSRESLDVKESTDNSVTIHVGGPGQPTSYYLQFYRLAPAEANETADSLGISFAKGS